AAVTEVQGRDGRGIAGVNRVGEGDGEGSGGGLRVEALIEDVRTVHATRGDEAVNALRTLVGLHVDAEGRQRIVLVVALADDVLLLHFDGSGEAFRLGAGGMEVRLEAIVGLVGRSGEGDTLIGFSLRGGSTNRTAN